MDSLQTYIPRKWHGKCSSSFSKDESVSFWSLNVWVATLLIVVFLSNCLQLVKMESLKMWLEEWSVLHLQTETVFALTIFFIHTSLDYIFYLKKKNQEKKENGPFFVLDWWQLICGYHLNPCVSQEEIRRLREEMDKKIYDSFHACSSGQPPCHSWSPSVQHVSWGLVGWDHVTIGCQF